MNTEKLEVDHLQENISMFQELDTRSQRYAIRAFHKAGHVLMYHHFKMRHGSVSFDGDDSIEDDLSYESLKNSNNPERYIQIALGGAMMEQLIAKSITNSITDADEDIDKSILLIAIHNRMNKRTTVEYDVRAFVEANDEVGTVLLLYQREARLFLNEILKRRVLTYSETLSLFKNNQS